MKAISLTPLSLKLTFWCLALLMLVPFLLLGTTAAKANTSQVSGMEANLLQQSKEQQLIEDWGIELVAMRTTAAGHMVDFRFRVVDATKAAPLLKQQTKRYLVHEASGKVLSVPNTSKVG